MTTLLERLKKSWQVLKQPQLKLEKLLIASWTLALLMIALSLLAGCSYLETQPRIPANLVVRCPDAPLFEGKDLGDLISYTADLLAQYHECRTRMDAVGVWADRA